MVQRGVTNFEFTMGGKWLEALKEVSPWLAASQCSIVPKRRPMRDVVAGHNLFGFRDEAIELLLVPYKIRALHSAGIAVKANRLSFR